ncbi:MAG TPA: septum formation initiator [Stellaceae bacterium]|nr:septum formation initiator [Stellaceae bacterium]
MTGKCWTAVAALLLLAIVPLAARADDKPKPAQPPEAPAHVETQHRLSLNGHQLDYRAIAETIALHDKKRAATASVFTISYVADVPPGQQRPVAFVFNGGPGAASVFLHLGALGPRILETPGDGSLPDPPYKTIDNPNTWLAFTDLVFVDPVGTGFSRGEGKDDPDKPFFNVRGDLSSLASVLRLWLTRHQRWAAPVYLVGESYGGYRAAALTQSLAEDVGITVNGVVLVSPALDMDLVYANVVDPMGAAFLIPSYAATVASLAGKPLSADAAAGIEAFALGDYVTGLLRMTGEPPAGDPFIARVAQTIGIDADTVRRSRGRVSNGMFVRELRRDRHEVLSIYDGTVKRATRGNPWDDHAGDPVLAPATAAFTAVFDAYAPEALGYHTELPYRVLPHDVAQHWDWDATNHGEGGLGFALTNFEQALLAHPRTKVLIVNGRHDLQTPYLSSRWLIDQLSIPSSVRQAIRLKVYDGGHMMYLRHDSLAALSRDAADLFKPD